MVAVPYHRVPRSVRARWEERLGSSVLAAATQPSGFSPGVAARLRLADGRRVFLKAVSARVNRDAQGIYRSEARVASRLPSSVPSPPFLWSLTTGPWTALAFEDVEGRHPRLPWRPNELARVLGTLEQMARDLTPSPIRLRSVAEAQGPSFHLWRACEKGGSGGPGTSRAIARLGPWVRDHLPNLAEAEARWERAVRGRTLLQSDYRADNLLLTPSKVYVVDWPWACVGVRWWDLLTFLPSVAMQGGPPPWRIFDEHPVARGARPQDVEAVLAALTGFFLGRGSSPPIPALPNLRPFQWAQGLQALRWLRYRWDGKDPGTGRTGSRRAPA